MSKKIWKWILTEAPDEEIVSLIDKFNIQIPGARRSQIPNNMKMFRPRMINQLLQPQYLFKVSSYYKTKIKRTLSDKVFASILEMEAVDIIAKVKEENWDYTDIIVVLLSSSESKHQEKGENLFKIWSNAGDLNKTDVIYDDTEKEEDVSIEDIKEKQSDEAVQEMTKLREQLIVLEDRIIQLEQQIKSDQEKHKNIQKNWEISKENYKSRIQELKKDINGKNQSLETKDQQIKQLQDQLKQKDEEIQDYLTNNKNQQKVIDGLKVEVVELEARLMASSANEIASSNEVKQDSAQPGQRIVHIIGNPKNKKVYSYSSYYITIIETNEIAEYIENKNWHDVQEFWLLTYVVPQGKVNRIRKIVPNEKLIEFSDFNQLDEFIYRRRT